MSILSSLVAASARCDVPGDMSGTGLLRCAPTRYFDLSLSIPSNVFRSSSRIFSPNGSCTGGCFGAISLADFATGAVSLPASALQRFRSYQKNQTRKAKPHTVRGTKIKTRRFLAQFLFFFLATMLRRTYPAFLAVAGRSLDCSLVISTGESSALQFMVRVA